VILDIDFDYLLLWGHYRLMIDMHEKLHGKINDDFIRLQHLNNVGLAYSDIGQVKLSIQSYNEGFESAKQTQKRQAEGVFLGNLGNAYRQLGHARKAIEFLEPALIILREIGDRKGEADALGGLGSAYASFGNIDKAIKFHEQALVIAHEISDRRGEGSHLSNLGNRYADLGDTRKAIDFYEQALVIAREIGSRGGEGIRLGNIAEQRINLGEYELAIQYAMQYAKICEEINMPASYAFGRLAQAYLHNSELVKAREATDFAQNHDDTENNHNISALHGIIALRQGERETAQKAFMKSIAQADEILAKTPEYYEALDAKGLALCGLALCADNGQLTMDRGQMIAEAIETFTKARKIAPHAGVVKSVLRLFDELVKCDEEGILKDVREAIEGK
jgi:tetratricopeptide (TPR) repeat protein